jgi:hypothetical protein
MRAALFKSCRHVVTLQKQRSANRSKKKKTPPKAWLNSQGFGAPSSHEEASNNPCALGCGQSDVTAKRI